MHSIFFGIKRAFHATLKRTRRPFAKVAPGLTAARFDVLYALQANRGQLTQNRLRDLLGVTGATVSRMLRSLEKLHVIWRERDWIDRRRLVVKLTDLGALWFFWAERSMRKDVSVSIANALTGGPGLDDASLHAMITLDEGLHAIRTAFGDRAWLAVYPGWHPDD